MASKTIEAVDGNRKKTMTQLEAMILIIKNKAIAGHSGASAMLELLHGLEIVDEEPRPRGVFFRRETMTQKEWEARYSHLGEARDSTTSSSSQNDTG